MKKSLIILSILIITALALAGLYAYLLYSLTKLGEKQRDFAGDIQNADKVLKEETENRERLLRFFIKDGDQALFVSTIEGACIDFKLTCGDPRSLTEVADASGAVKTLSMTISAEGAFESLMGLIAYFESSAYPVELSQSAFFSKEPEMVSATSTMEWEGVFEISVPVIINP